MNAPDWAPFVLAPPGTRSDSTRPIDTVEGIGDRMRVAAFAELQAREAFRWAADRFAAEAPAELLRAWMTLVAAEDRHLGWLMRRMEVLGVSAAARTVSDHLWHSLMNCRNAEEFTIYIASAEERGRKAGARFGEVMRARDPESAAIFAKIAEEEVSHIELATRFFPGSHIVARANRGLVAASPPAS